MPLRVAIIAPFYKPSIGGVEYIVFHTAKELLKRGFDVHVISTIYDNRWRRVAAPGTTLEEGIHVHRLESNIKIGYSTLMRGLRYNLKRIRPDIVHCHNLHPHLFQALRWKEEFGFRLIAQLHYPVAAGIDSLLARILYHIAIRELVRNQWGVDAFIAHTIMEKKWLINEGIGEERIKVVRYPGIPEELFSYKPVEDIHERLRADKVIVSVSRLHPRKGQHLLVRSIYHLREQVRDFKVYIAGPVSNTRYLRKLGDLIKRYGLERYVILHPGPLSEKEKLDSIATSDVFACTPTRDLHPIVILESLALGTPIVATSVGAIPELLDPSIVLERLRGGTPHNLSDRSVGDAKGEKHDLSYDNTFKKLENLRNTVVRIVDTQPHEIKDAIASILSKGQNGYDDVTLFAKPYTFSSITEDLVDVYNLALEGKEVR